MAEVVLDSLLFVGSCLLFLVTPFLRRRLAGVLWLLIAIGELWVSTIAISVKGGTLSSVLLYIGYGLMFITGTLMLRDVRHSVYGVYGLAIWFGLVFLRFFEMGVIPSLVVASMLVAWAFGWDRKTQRQA